MSEPQPLSGRFVIIDLLRGVALGLMIVYHFCWDLNFFGLARLDLFGDWWLALRTSIVCSFLVLAGVSLVLAHGRAIRWRGVGRRLGVLALAAVAISAVSYWFFPESPIFFGVLHHMALAGVLGLAFLHLAPPLTLLVAGLCLWAPALFAAPTFDAGWLQWIGLMTHEPGSNDYVPVLPWFGAVLAGIAIARLVPWDVPAVRSLLAWTLPAPAAALAWFGRRSLIVYLCHQPILFAGFYLFIAIFGAGEPGGTMVPFESPQILPRAEGFLGSCQVSCEKNGGSQALCGGYCRCVVDDLNSQGLWQPYMTDRLDLAGRTKLATIIQGCVERQRPRP